MYSKKKKKRFDTLGMF